MPPTQLTKEEFLAKLERAARQKERGEFMTFASAEELDKYLRGL